LPPFPAYWRSLLCGFVSSRQQDRGASGDSIEWSLRFFCSVILLLRFFRFCNRLQQFVNRVHQFWVRGSRCISLLTKCNNLQHLQLKLEKDTIPKPGGLVRAARVAGCLSGFCPGLVRPLSRPCPAFVQRYFAMRSAHGRQHSAYGIEPVEIIAPAYNRGEREQAPQGSAAEPRVRVRPECFCSFPVFLRASDSKGCNGFGAGASPP
jgi:hypothetical protein